MHALHHGDNTEAMRQRINILMARFPQVQMVMFSELLAKGAGTQHAQPFPNSMESMFCELALQH